MSSPRYGLDTGFFFALMRGDDRPWSVWTSITDGAASGVVSTLSVYELQRNAMKGLLVREDVEAFLDDLPLLCTMHDTLSSAAAQRAARLGWGNGLSMADALILQAFLDEEVTHVLTTDHDLTVYEGGPSVEVL
jgi:predicted nucleic acid-binding protein